MSSPAVLQNSSFSTPFTTVDLTHVQAQVVAALAQGRSVTSAAAEAGVHRTTVHNWLRASNDFHTAVEQAKTFFAQSLADELRDLSAAALETLRTLLTSPDTPPAVRLKAALAVLERPHFPKAGWQLPGRIETPREPRALAVINAVDSDCEPSATPRNAPCPCGSGLKYKRCCGQGAPPALHA